MGLAKKGKKKTLYQRFLRSGENAPNWKGGITTIKFPLPELIRQSDEYKCWRKQVFERDNYICQECFMRGIKLNVHHKEKKFSVIFEEFLKTYSQFSPIEDKETLVRLAITYEPFWDVSNGIVYCEKCHRGLNHSKKIGYGSNKDLAL